MSVEQSNPSGQEEVNHGKRVIDALNKQSNTIVAKGTALNPDTSKSPFTSADQASINAYNKSVEAFLKKNISEDYANQLITAIEAFDVEAWHRTHKDRYTDAPKDLFDKFMKEINTEFHLRDYIYQHLGFDPKGMWVMPVTKDRQEGFQKNVESYLDSFKTLQKDIAQFHQQFPKIEIGINEKESKEFNYTSATPEEIRATLSVLRHELSKYPENYTKSLQFYCNIGKGDDFIMYDGTYLTLPVNQGAGPSRLAIHNTIALQLGIKNDGSLYTAERLHFPGPLTTMLKESDDYDGIRPVIHTLTGCTYQKSGNTYIFKNSKHLQKNSPYYQKFQYDATHWNKILGSASSIPSPATDVPSQQLRTTGSLETIINSYKVFQPSGEEKTNEHGPVIQDIFKAQLKLYATENADQKHPLTPVIKDLMTQHGSYVSRIHIIGTDTYKVHWKVSSGEEKFVEMKVDKPKT